MEQSQQQEPIISENFTFYKKKTLHFPDSVAHAFGIAANLLFTDAYIITIDQMSSKVHLLDNTGNYLANTGRKGRGPGEYSFLQFWDYDHDTLYLYDGGLKKFSLLQLPSLEIIREFTMADIRISDFKVVHNKIVAITPPLEQNEGLISLIDPTSQSILHRIHTPKDFQASIYFSRNSTGELKKVDNNTVLLLYPDEKYLYSYEILADSILPRTEYSFETSHNRFRPKIQPFPQNLNPYENNEGHREWIDSQTQFYWLSFLSPDIIVIIGSFHQENEFTYFLNAYKIDGKVLFEGLLAETDSLALPLHSSGEYLVFPVRDEEPENSFDFYLAAPKVPNSTEFSD